MLQITPDKPPVAIGDNDAITGSDSYKCPRCQCPAVALRIENISNCVPGTPTAIIWGECGHIWAMDETRQESEHTLLLWEPELRIP